MGRQAKAAGNRDEVRSGTGLIQPQAQGSIEQVAANIRTLVAKAKAAASSATEQMALALTTTAEAGDYLKLAQRGVHRSQWDQWLQGVGLNHQEASRYMRLADHPNRVDFRAAPRLLSHALELAGIAEQATSTKPGEAEAGKTRLPESLDAIAVCFKRWRTLDFSKRIHTAPDDLLIAWYEGLKPMAEAFRQVELRLKK